MSQPASRIGDNHNCSAVNPSTGNPHTGDPIPPGEIKNLIGTGTVNSVFINGKVPAVDGDFVFCPGAVAANQYSGSIIATSTSVFIEGKKAARKNDIISSSPHVGIITNGSKNVNIGG